MVLWVWGKKKSFTNISSFLANLRNWYNKWKVQSDTSGVDELSFISCLKHRWPLPALSGFKVFCQDITVRTVLYLTNIFVPKLQLLIAQHNETLLGSSYLIFLGISLFFSDRLWQKYLAFLFFVSNPDIWAKQSREKCPAIFLITIFSNYC